MPASRDVSCPDQIRSTQNNSNLGTPGHLGILPLCFQLQQETRITAIRRLNISLPDTLTTLVPGEVEKGETGWAAHPAECPSEEQISLVEGGGITSETRIYTDGSNTEKGVGQHFASGQDKV
ncbi:hypothetical protein AVEN_159329-1 [Araneus ventricosus]|uniref:RNase H type-1 domain-containing protein n=1 Tax=Araneus ventricosus TaxID=182803 RepID=A0A4Y2A0V1_ARAVE|nr:hypothetical protein AVEN_159329-1 [Araneus ventricosus]